MSISIPSAAELGAFGIEPTWSRTLDVPSHDGATHRWHVLDRPGTDDKALTILCLHGNPTWSYLWSRVLNETNQEHRIIAPDHLSMGWSDKVGVRRYRERVADIYDLLAAMNVTGPLLIVAQDWGGAIAMGVAVGRPELVAGLVLSNTGIAVPKGRRAPRLISLSARDGFHQLITRNTPLFVRGTALLSGRGLTRLQRKALSAPYRNRTSRDGVAGFVSDVPFTDTHPSAHDLALVAEKLPHLTIPVRLIWGSRDPVFNDDFAEDLRARFPDASLHRIADAGHLAVLETSIATFIEATVAEIGNTKHMATSTSFESETAISGSLWSRIGIAENPRSLAISDAAANESVSDAEFALRVASFATALHSQGIVKGDRVAVLVPPSINLIAVVYACWRIGAVTVIADRGLGLRGLGRAVRSARVQHVVGPKKALVAARSLRWAPHAAYIDVEELDPSKVQTLNEVTLASPAPSDAAAVLFTSGATGPAKGVCYTHQQLCAQRDALEVLYGITRDDRFVAAFAPFALFGPALGICTGLADMDVSSPSTLTASALDDACKRIDATMVFASPAALANVVSTARDAVGGLRSLASVRLVMSAGAPVPSGTLHAMAELCPHAEFHTPYGMTEVLPVADISLQARDELGVGKGVCVGKPVTGCEAMVIPVNAHRGLLPLACGDTGEIVVTSPWLSSGYDKLWLTQTAARPIIHSDGVPRTWHRTGDVGHCDADGNLWVEGRVSHVIHTANGSVTPVPLEIAVEAVPTVQRAAAVAVGEPGTQFIVIVVETQERNDGPAPAQLAVLIRQAVAPVSVAAVWTTKKLPVDIRHNAKIDRTALGISMLRVLSGSRR